MPAFAPPTDFVRRFLFEDLDIRGALVRLTSAWQSMRRDRGYPPAVERLLGEVTAVAALIASNVKQAGRLTVQVQGRGPVSLLVVDCSASLGIRGMARFAKDAPDASDAELIGDGRLAITLLTEVSPRPYQSLVPLEGSSIATIFENFLAQSEQTPARLWLAANGERATGLFLQKLPGADKRDADGWNRIERLASTVRASELEGLPVDTLLTRLFPEETLRLFNPAPIAYDCPEDWDKVRRMLRSLGEEELRSLLAEQGHVLVRDDICNREYRLDADAVAALFAGASEPGTEPGRSP